MVHVLLTNIGTSKKTLVMLHLLAEIDSLAGALYSVRVVLQRAGAQLELQAALLDGLALLAQLRQLVAVHLTQTRIIYLRFIRSHIT